MGLIDGFKRWRHESRCPVQHIGRGHHISGASELGHALTITFIGIMFGRQDAGGGGEVVRKTSATGHGLPFA